MSWTRVTIDRNNYRFPNRCPDCLKYGAQELLSIPSDAEKVKGYYIVAIKYEHLRVRIPFCSECASKRLRNARYGRWLFWGLMAGGVAIAVWLDLGRWETFAVGVAVGSPAIWLMYYRSQQVRLSTYTQETMTFSFKHPEYADEFARLNNANVSS